MKCFMIWPNFGMEGTWVISGAADDLNWIDISTERILLSAPAIIPNAIRSSLIGLILQLSNDLQSILSILHFAPGTLEDVRYIIWTSVVLMLLFRLSRIDFFSDRKRNTAHSLSFVKDLF